MSWRKHHGFWRRSSWSTPGSPFSPGEKSVVMVPPSFFVGEFPWSSITYHYQLILCQFSKRSLIGLVLGTVYRKPLNLFDAKNIRQNQAFLQIFLQIFLENPMNHRLFRSAGAVFGPASPARTGCCTLVEGEHWSGHRGSQGNEKWMYIYIYYITRMGIYMDILRIWLGYRTIAIYIYT